MSKQAKMIARWLHENLTWKKILMTWMVVLVASKMVLLMLTFEYFSLTALISLQIFHGVWTIAFFCLNVHPGLPVHLPADVNLQAGVRRVRPRHRPPQVLLNV